MHVFCFLSPDSAESGSTAERALTADKRREEKAVLDGEAFMVKTGTPEQRTPTPTNLDRQTSVKVGVKQGLSGSKEGVSGVTFQRYTSPFPLSHEAGPSRAEPIAPRMGVPLPASWEHQGQGAAPLGSLAASTPCEWPGHRNPDGLAKGTSERGVGRLFHLGRGGVQDCRGCCGNRGPAQHAEHPHIRTSAIESRPPS